MVISFSDPTTSIGILRSVRALRPEVPVLVRTQDDARLKELQDAGATDVVPETFEASLMLVSHVLMLLHVPVSRVVRTIGEIRNNRYTVLHNIVRAGHARPVDESSEHREEIKSVVVPPGAWSVGRTLQEVAAAAWRPPSPACAAWASSAASRARRRCCARGTSWSSTASRRSWSAPRRCCWPAEATTGGRGGTLFAKMSCQHTLYAGRPPRPALPSARMPRMHKSRLSGFIIDCNTADLEGAAAFWGAALGLKVEASAAGRRGALPPARGLAAGHRGAAGRRHPSRVHLDIESTDVEAEVRRLEKLGARRVSAVRDWQVMEAPTGQLFCVVRRAGVLAQGNTWND